MPNNRTIGIAAAVGIAGAGALALFLAVPSGEPVSGTITPGEPAEASGSAVELEWEDLVPGDSGYQAASGVVEHDQSLGAPEQNMETAEIRAELDGQRVRLPGYMTPLNFEDAEVGEFLLVPYVGACIHVPPPPPNQIVYVTMDGTVPVLDLWQPMVAEGTLKAQAHTTELAEVGYTMQLSHLEIYEEEELEVFDDLNGAEPPISDVTEPSQLGDVFREANEG